MEGDAEDTHLEYICSQLLCCRDVKDIIRRAPWGFDGVCVASQRDPTWAQPTACLEQREI